MHGLSTVPRVRKGLSPSAEMSCSCDKVTGWSKRWCQWTAKREGVPEAVGYSPLRRSSQDDMMFQWICNSDRHSLNHKWVPDACPRSNLKDQTRIYRHHPQLHWVYPDLSSFQLCITTQCFVQSRGMSGFRSGGLVTMSQFSFVCMVSGDIRWSERWLWDMSMC